MPGSGVFCRSRFTRARDEQMVERGQRIDLHLRVALEPVLPDADILVDHLIVAPTMNNQDRQVEAARDRDLIACVEII